MPITVQWDDDTKTIIRMNYADPWNWNEFQDAIQQTNTLVGENNARIDIINDLNGAGVPSSDVLMQFRSATRYADPLNGLVIVVGANTFGEAMFNMFRKLYPDRSAHWRSAKTVDEARALIREDRKTKE